MTILEAFGKAIKDQRQKLSFSQEELAFRCGLHRTYIGSVERGERNISLLNIFKIVEALEIRIDELFDQVMKHIEDRMTNY